MQFAYKRLTKGKQSLFLGVATTAALLPPQGPSGDKCSLLFSIRRWFGKCNSENIPTQAAHTHMRI